MHGFRGEWEDDTPHEFVQFLFYLLYLSSVGLYVDCALEIEGMSWEMTQEDREAELTSGKK